MDKQLTAGMRFYTYDQNNTGGNFVSNDYVAVPAWERPMRQCHHGYYGDCPKCEAETGDSAEGAP